RLPARGGVAPGAAGADRSLLGGRAIPGEALGAAPCVRAGGGHRRRAGGAARAGGALVGRDPANGRWRVQGRVRAPEGSGGGTARIETEVSVGDGRNGNVHVHEAGIATDEHEHGNGGLEEG